MIQASAEEWAALVMLACQVPWERNGALWSAASRVLERVGRVKGA